MAMGSPASPRNVGAVQPPRAARLLHTRRILSKPSRPPSPFPLSSSLFPLSPLPPSVALSSSGPPPILVLALLRHPRCGFLSSVSLCLPFPRRAVASRAAFATRARTLFSPPRACIYRSHTRPLSHTARFPRCMPRCISLPWRALLGSRPRRQDPPDYTVCVFYEPRRTALASANARADFRVALIALGAKCGMRGFSSSKHRYLPPVCFVSLAVTGDKRFPPPSRIFRALIKARMKGRVSNRVSRHFGANARCNRALTARTVGLLLCVNFNYRTLCEFMHHFAYFTGVTVEEFGSSRSKNVLECTR